jgi:hypothetical protein
MEKTNEILSEILVPLRLMLAKQQEILAALSDENAHV